MSAETASTPPEEPAEAFRIELAEVTSARIDHAAPAPASPSWTAARHALQRALKEVKAPADAIVMVGEGPDDAAWAEAAFLAKFIPSEAYFPAPE